MLKVKKLITFGLINSPRFIRQKKQLISLNYCFEKFYEDASLYCIKNIHKVESKNFIYKSEVLAYFLKL